MDVQKHAEAYNFKDIAREQSNYKEAKPVSSREAETAQYIADMVLELRNMAKANSFKVLSELLEITYYEAFSCANKIDIPPGEADFIHALGADARKAAAG